MATAYALLTSLMNLLRDLHEHTHPPIRLDEEHVKPLSSSICFFQEFLQEHRTAIDLGLEIRIADAARDVDDVIETYIADRIKYLVELYRGLEGVIKDLDDLIKKEAMEMDQSHPFSSSKSPLATYFVLSIEDIATKIMDKLTLRHKFDPAEIIPMSAYKSHRRQVDSLCSKIQLLQGFMKDHNIVDNEMEIRIAAAAHAAEDHIETHILRLIRDQEDFYGSLQRAIEGLDLIRKEAIMEINQNERNQGKNHQPERRPMPLTSSPSPSATTDDNITIGIEDKTTKIVGKLASQHKSDRQVFSITGMGGIGKTTLARKVYNHPYIKNYFDIRVWATISKDYNTHGSLVELLRCLDDTSSKESLSETSEHELGLLLHKSLFGMRYLVILDDVWDVEAWDRLRSFFPASSGSGIVITTRESTVASIGSSDSFGMDLLDETKSWDLFCKNVFGKDNCPPEVEDVGKNIANRCRGLPLSIVVIGGHLAKSPRTQEYWEYVADNLSLVVNSENDGNCLKILSLSYTNLPVHLKPCFLHMGTFREDEVINVDQLIRLWVVLGFVRPITGKSLEEAAKDYLNNLIGRNLILTDRNSTRRGKIKSCKIHDLMRDLCLIEARKENFISIVRKQMPDFPEGDNKTYQGFGSSLGDVNRSRMLRIDRKYSSLKHTLSKEVLCPDSEADFPRMANLQSLQVTYKLTDELLLIISPPIRFLWNLQYLIIEDHKEAKAPPEIWEMPQLRYIKIHNMGLPDPPSESNDILTNLQSAKTILNFPFTEDLVRKIPNIKKLTVNYDDEREGFDETRVALDNIARLEKLESFACSLVYVDPTTSDSMIRDLTFPKSLKKLFFNCLNWEDVTTKIGSLPLLESLHLINCWGSEWDLVDGNFSHLKYLCLALCSDLPCFTGDTKYFPCLQELTIAFMDCLVEISEDIGDISTLRSIELKYCPDSAVVSLKEIAEVQWEMGNEELQIEVILTKESSLSSESLSTSNFHLLSYYH